ncbi:MAG: rane or secreted protein, partial [Segetibacter sp.]|nr:rane or secreted protein [Segetibacter sp.]
RNIKILITPIAFWGNGYPERDEKTKGFSSIYPKQKALVNDTAILAQENNLKQIFKHVNPYTKLTYGTDTHVIAIEINNETHNSCPKEKVTEYVNRMAAAVRSTGWTKPVFYNISESSTYADAVAKANVDGHSFQWYPTGLVANRTLQGNYLPNVDVYKIPFGDTIPAYRNRARMVYEFDAGDVLQPIMYPAMARSFRTAGFQWATQFAYDPLATAYANTEYQTHYVNLAYTPSKAISLLIASKVFHKVPRLKSYGAYPADTTFDVFRVSYKNALSEMNDDEEFYYSNTTTSTPKNITKLKHIAGVGNSPVVSYNGTGAYFLDKLNDATWRLEVMPDALFINDPFGKASPKREVARIVWQEQLMQVMLPGLGNEFNIKAVNNGNSYATTASGNSFKITPGKYLLYRTTNANDFSLFPASIKEFVAPASSSNEPLVIHNPFAEVSNGKSFPISAKIIGVDSADKISIELRTSSNKWRTLSMQRKAGHDYSADVPAEMVSPGTLNYRIVIQKPDKSFVVFPGNHKGDPYAWDAYINESYEVHVALDNAPIQLFNPKIDRNTLMLYNTDWRNNNVQYLTSNRPGQLVLKATVGKPTANSIIGFHTFIADKISGRKTEVTAADKIIIRARTDSAPTQLRLAFITADAAAFAANITLTNSFQDIEIPITNFKHDSSLLLPRPYPGFLPLWFKTSAAGSFKLSELDKMEITFGNNFSPASLNKPVSIEIEYVELVKSK